MKNIINFLVGYNINFSYSEDSLNVMNNSYLVDKHGTQDYEIVGNYEHITGVFSYQTEEEVIAKLKNLIGVWE
ncbi:hypothetical protein SAM2_00034 [Staphylococcus phage SAM2]|uniref:Uncharacterized protein n=1 Tax=Staphylococcus phage SAM2 TaxID=2724323 RepID=A0A8E3XDQ0_9CAUD|nr:hypothetical protein SAM2_00034 [Staphylococcus phage SAM2]